MLRSNGASPLEAARQKAPTFLQILAMPTMQYRFVYRPCRLRPGRRTLPSLAAAVGAHPALPEESLMRLSTQWLRRASLTVACSACGCQAHVRLPTLLLLPTLVPARHTTPLSMHLWKIRLLALASRQLSVLLVAVMPRILLSGGLNEMWKQIVGLPQG